MDIETTRRVVQGMLRTLKVPALRWGAVSSNAPLRVRYPGETLDLPFEPPALFATGKLAPGDKVLTGQWLGETVLLGVRGGPRRESAIAIPNAADLNTYTTDGDYYQPSNAQAATGSNYPEPLAMLLRVRTGGGMVWHEAITYPGAGGTRVWTRGLYGSWQAWALNGPGLVSWASLATASGYTSNGLQVKRSGSTVSFRGSVLSTNFASTGTKTVIAAGGIDALCRPLSYRHARQPITIIGGTAPVGYCDVGTDGAMNIQIVTAGSGTPEAFINLKYDVDGEV